jgi:predicted GTPase
MAQTRVVIVGAAGRDFHNFNTLFRNDEAAEVVAFTATQIPGIEGRLYPPELAGPLYPDGIPIHPESELEALIRQQGVEQVWFSYSDVSHEEVMHLASRVTAWGAHFGVCSATRTMLPASRPVIAVTAVRTGAGKSQTTRFISRILRESDLRVAVVRHPMPYGNLRHQACQRFASYEDLERHRCTIEEREEYEPHLDQGSVVFAGVDYQQILAAAEAEADVLIWDGGNNDTPFFAPDLHLTVLDPHRAGHETSYYPGETNFLMADVLLVNKVDSARPEDLAAVLESCRRHNPSAQVMQCRSAISVEEPEALRGRSVVVVEDGPTLTHGGMSFGAGILAARAGGAAEIVDPAPFASGSLAETYQRYPNARGVLPAMGYGEAQIRDLEATLRAVPAEVVVAGTPIDLRKLVSVGKPILRVRYELEEVEPGALAQRVLAVAKAA